MFNMNYKESEHMKEVRENYLESVKSESIDSIEAMSDSLEKLDYSIEEKFDSENAYLDGYLKDQTDAMVLNGIGWALCRIIPEALDRLKK